MNTPPIDWSRPQDITTRDGRKVRIFVTDAAGNYPVVGQIVQPNGPVMLWRSDGVWSLDMPDNPADLIQTTPKQRVPLGPLDVPPGSALRQEHWGVGVYKLILFAGPDELVVHSYDAFAGEMHVIDYTYMANTPGWQIKRPGEEWGPAWKEA